MAKLIDLATEELKKDKDAKALENLGEAVEENKIAFDLALHEAKKTARSAEKTIEAMSKNPNVTPSALVDAQDKLAVAKKTVEQLTTAIAERF